MSVILERNHEDIVTEQYEVCSHLVTKLDFSSDRRKRRHRRNRCVCRNTWLTYRRCRQCRHRNQNRKSQRFSLFIRQHCCCNQQKTENCCLNSTNCRLNRHRHFDHDVDDLERRWQSSLSHDVKLHWNQTQTIELNCQNCQIAYSDSCYHEKSFQ